jgi:DNA ligase-1
LVAEVYEKIENTTKRLEITRYLVDLFKQTPKDVIEMVVYLSQGRIFPKFVGIELGIAEKLALKAVAKATGGNVGEIEENLDKTGDLGVTIQKLLEKKRQTTFFEKPLTVQRVYKMLSKASRVTGSGSTNQKIGILASLLVDATPKEARYIMRIIMGKLRLGMADMTVLDALAVAFTSGKDTRSVLERAYNISSDLGKVAKIVLEKGVSGLKNLKISLGKPIRPMLAQRLSSPLKIFEKLGGICIAEYKYDGERIQIHKNGDNIILFSRGLENITEQYRDVTELIRDNVLSRKVILEAECVAIDKVTGELKPFQELMHRRRKYETEKAMKEYPISLFIFDVLYVDGRDLTLVPLPIRHEILRNLFKKNDRIQIAKYKMIKHPDEMEKFFEEAIENGCEGLVCKSVNDKSLYKAGSKGWQWIKYKRDYKSEMVDTVDLVIVGAYHGRGKRAGTYGALLLSAYNPVDDIFVTLCKCGTGFTDEDLKRIPKIMNSKRITKKHPRVNSNLEADVWFEPQIVIEVIGAEITLSPIHTCAINTVREGSGLAIRFPRFTGRYRIDKMAENATTEKEIVQMYKSQLKSV